MLRAYDAQVIAYQIEGGVVHTECLAKDGEDFFEAMHEREGRPLSRYEIGNWKSEEGYEDARWLMESGREEIMYRMDREQQEDWLSEILDHLLEGGEAYTLDMLTDWVEENLARDTILCDDCMEEIS